jgi:hypothetical protein
MKNLMKRISRYRKATSLLAVFALTFSLSTSVWANERVAKWTSVGSVGIPDEQDRDLVNYNLGRVGLLSSAPDRVDAVLRYNVNSLSQGKGISYLTVRYADNGAETQVIVRLRQYVLNTGSDTVLLEFDSDDFASSPNYQTRTVGSTGTEFDRFYLDFQHASYYIEVVLKKAGASGNPALGIVQISGEWAN